MKYITIIRDRITPTTTEIFMGKLNPILSYMMYVIQTEVINPAGNKVNQ